jgi:hypothetical protein
MFQDDTPTVYSFKNEGKERKGKMEKTNFARRSPMNELMLEDIAFGKRETRCRKDHHGEK